MSLRFSSRYMFFFFLLWSLQVFLRLCFCICICVLSHCCPARSISISWRFWHLILWGMSPMLSIFLSSSAGCFFHLDARYRSFHLSWPPGSSPVVFFPISQIYTWQSKNLHLLLSLRFSLSCEDGRWQVYSTLSDCIAAAPFSWITYSWLPVVGS